MKLKRKTEEDRICREDGKKIAKKGIMTVIRMVIKKLKIHTHTGGLLCSGSHLIRGKYMKVIEMPEAVYKPWMDPPR